MTNVYKSIFTSNNSNFFSVAIDEVQVNIVNKGFLQKNSNFDYKLQDFYIDLKII